MAKIAIIGTGISGLGAAYLLHCHHDITVYEKTGRIGGHSRTVNLRYGDATLPVDTGFIVFNERNYPHLTGLFRHLNVPCHESEMSFSCTIGGGWLEWGAKDLNAMLGQRRNLFRPGFYRLARDVARFNAEAEDIVEAEPRLSLRGLIERLQLGDWFRRYYLLPMGGAIWSCPPQDMLDFPARSFVRFFINHGLMALSGQPQWYTVTGGAQEYVKRLSAPFVEKIRTGIGATRVTRADGKVTVTDANGVDEIYDQIVLACHGDEAFALLADPSAAETTVLSAFRYQKNHMVLHRDESVMPKRKACWASWVYHASRDTQEPKISVTYWMNSLQGIPSRYPLFVTLNPTQSIAPEYVFDEHMFEHPMFDAAAIAAQEHLPAIQGARNTWFCGAHWRHGFHEDGLMSAVAVAEGLGVSAPWGVREPPTPISVPNPTPEWLPVSAVAG